MNWAKTWPPPFVYLFDTQPVPINWTNSDGDITTKTAWDKKLKMFSANGGTAPSRAVRAMISQNINIEQIVIITDEEENSGVETFTESLKDYQRKMGLMPAVVFVRIGHSIQMENSCKSANIEFDVFPVTNIDKVSMPNLLNLLSRKGTFDIVQEILSISLPNKTEFDKKHGIKPGDLKRKIS